MPIIQKTKHQFTLTIPTALVKAKGWQKGDKIDFLIDNLGQVILRKSSGQ